MIKLWGFVALLFLSVVSSAQERQIVLPVQMDASIIDSERKSEISFFEYPYTSDSIDLRHFKRVTDSYDIPNYITIDAPNLEGYSDVYILISSIYKTTTEDDLIIWLAGNYKTNEVTFFIDKNLDRNFNNDDKSFLLRADQDPVKIKFSPGGRDTEHSLFLDVPDRIQEEKDRIKKFRNYKVPIQHKFSVELQGGFGVGSIEYNYDNTATGFPAWYDVNISSKILGVSVNYDTQKLKFSVGMTYQSLFYYTSYTNVQLGEPELRMTVNGLRLVENVRIDRNAELQPRDIIQFTGSVAYKMRIGRNTQMQPYIGVGVNKFTPSDYVPFQFTKPDEVFDLKSNPYVDLGVKFEFTVGAGKAIYLGFSHNSISWEPDGFVESLTEENYESNYQIWRGIVGYRFAF